MFLETSTFGKNLGRNGSAFASLLSTFPFLVIASEFPSLLGRISFFELDVWLDSQHFHDISFHFSDAHLQFFPIAIFIHGCLFI